ncbi:phenylalanyl-tRNA synthetase beta chain [Candidatus Hakubella thermalkaliphila]|uniref:Phenylalanine--tRNA ligase beta subunit n=1 Tax=Candidatus Hakubella thermalkaliphila TaxID=2754717 RepID=A0A6V8PNR2_9ACTN|nr:phenylalanine--tRNA ligase subunit beta [Candidatus Hakubella thermalkaliphila]GFP34285.1 phenylalanyl-tRNA synthetase beta chain [Candidatus Hakubella thermalkaliphila]
MRVPYNWLKEYVDLSGISPPELADRLVMTGTAVESVQTLKPSFQQVIVGEIKEMVRHPRADKLWICQVSLGHRPATIVCGATNIKVGDKVPVARPGAILQGAVLEAREIREVKSQGMLCSEAELGLGEDQSGILILDPSCQVGLPLDEALGLRDTVLELEITPNRPDCLGLIGIAREVAAIFGRPLTVPSVNVEEGELPASHWIGISIADSDLCLRYSGRLLQGVEVKPSPLWMQVRLGAVGLRPINNVVDVTNYVMWETSQPLHAFDYGKIENQQIIVRRAREGEKIVTLDGVERYLESEMLVIADAHNPVAIAGVMGGVETEVSENTTVTLLESANFDPVSILRTSQKLGLRSEASNRFEKGLDPNQSLYALDRAAMLMREVAGGTILKGAVDIYPRRLAPWRLQLRPKRVIQILGCPISKKEIKAILGSLELEVSGEEPLEVTVPTFRRDLEREIDLIEEVARLYGYDKFPSTLPASSGRVGELSWEQKRINLVREVMIGCGLWETINYSFTDHKSMDKAGLKVADPRRHSVAIANPIIEDFSILKTTLLPGLLQVIEKNCRVDKENVFIFELAKTYHPRDGQDLPHEPRALAAAITGLWFGRFWSEPVRKVDFYDLKGIVEELARALDLQEPQWLPTSYDPFYEGKCAWVEIGGERIGIAGQVHPLVIKRYEIPNEVFAFELDLDRILALPTCQKEFRGIPRYPSITVDLALIVDEEVNYLQVRDVIQTGGGKGLKDVTLFDVYRGRQIPEGKKSLAFSLTFQEEDRTLRDEEVQEKVDRIVQELNRELGAELRSR